ncbi:MAG: RidA family protein [Rhodospirillaceae bacterium]|jgi:enamine deaminase RidA (YjgF/YER057c/UK114 family)|nr:RidA family protein [Rhodospirillaceae bacterium]MBT3886408.1 RidA family protein [Rhodospirillaceae bacterium]MBT4118074.1 RidA family protein [Rhodospirillaceae bacterium]MBT4670880.1 RidA family protein [Rhodospirillaceae bacterium]MBT4721477.1 RidA family protein [Rhodospirillaceae bacterium]
MTKIYNPDGVTPPAAAYSHAAVVPAGTDLMIIAGQLGIDADGNLGDGIAEQAERAYTNIATILAAEGMTPSNIVRLQMFLTDRSYREAAGAARQKVFGDAKPPSTLLVVAGLAAPEFLIEIEAMAARG